MATASASSIYADVLEQEIRREEDELSTEIKKCGLGGMRNYIQKKLDSWKDVNLNIGVTGENGTGKSKFVNAVRGLKSTDTGAAKVGVTETTVRAESYSHPDNKNCLFVDLPGVGSPTFTRSNYCSDPRIGFDNYDVFIIIISTRVREDDMWLAKQIAERNKKFIFVRSKIAIDIRNEKDDHNGIIDVPEFEKKVIQKIRDDCRKNLEYHGFLNEALDIFLIDSGETNHRFLDFSQLVRRILYSLDDLKREAFVLTMTKNSAGIIEDKRKVLIKRTYKVALLSAAIGLVPVPGVSGLFDIKIVKREYEFDRKQFGIDEKSIKKLSTLYLASGVFKSFTTCLDLMVKGSVAVTTGLFTGISKVGIPVIGSIISSGVSYTTTVFFMQRNVNELAEECKEFNRFIMENTKCE